MSNLFKDERALRRRIANLNADIETLKTVNREQEGRIEAFTELRRMSEDVISRVLECLESGDLSVKLIRELEGVID